VQSEPNDLFSVIHGNRHRFSGVDSPASRAKNDLHLIRFSKDRTIVDNSELCSKLRNPPNESSVPIGRTKALSTGNDVDWAQDDSR
jgi:hypothetical protein